MHINNDFNMLCLDFQALLRPGRFDRHITIDFPTLAEREEIFEMYLRNLKLKTQSAELPGKLSQLTPGMSGMLIFKLNAEFQYFSKNTNVTVISNDFRNLTMV